MGALKRIVIFVLLKRSLGLVKTRILVVRWSRSSMDRIGVS
jgi:hypothetical protein